MFQYVLAFLLINTYYQSLGNPVPTTTAVNHPNTIANYLLALNQCENKFISEQIDNKIQDCNITAPPYREQELHCLMYYDINKQLCSSKLLKNEDYTAQINDSQDINTFCSSVKDFVFTNLTEFPFYKALAEKLFNNSVTCGKVCGYSEITNLETKYYCKYFKWGYDLLNNKTATVSQGGKESASEADISIRNIVIPVSNNDLNHTPGRAPLKPETHTDEGKSTEKSVEQAPEASLSKPITNNQIPVKPDEETEKIGVADPSVVSVGVKPSSSTVKAISTIDERTRLSSKDLGADTVKDPLEHTDDHANSDDAEYAMNGSDGDNGSNQGDDEGILLESNKIIEQVNDIVPKNGADISPKGYTRTESEDYPEEGDNFFPFFLTAVVLVVLLYILYHNKNKVTKVFFGLILEGRQGGRRRNSRGHAYRRLDTLEQAMSAKTPLPPSKIIY